MCWEESKNTPKNALNQLISILQPTASKIAQMFQQDVKIMISLIKKK